jgi:hypothetical protein
MKLSVQAMVAKEHKQDVMTGVTRMQGIGSAKEEDDKGMDGGMLENETEQAATMVMVMTLIGE